MPAFDVVVATFLEELFALQPEVATAVGDHRHDGRWPDMSEAGPRGAGRVHRPLGGDADRRSMPGR